MSSAYATSENERYDDQPTPFPHHVMFARPSTPEQSEAIKAVYADRNRRVVESERRRISRQDSDSSPWQSRPSVTHTTSGAHTSGAQLTPSASSSTTQVSRSSKTENPDDPPPGPPAHGHSAGGAPNNGDQRNGNVTTAPYQGREQDAPQRDMEAEKLAGEPEGWRRIVRNFTTPWFTVNMGTGLISILLYRVPQPYNARWLRILGIIVFILNLVLFIIFSAISTVRFILFPKVIGKVVRCEKESLFLGAYVMGLATLVNMFVYVCVESGGWGPWALNFAWAWFFVCAVLAFGSVCVVPFLMVTLHTHELPSMTGAWLMPVLPPIVVSGTGAIVATALANSPHHSPTHALWTIILSYVLWGAGMPLAFGLSAILLARLTLHRQLPSTDIVSMLIPIGPLGTGGFSIQTLGKVSRTTFPATGVLLGQTSGDVLYTFGFILALIMWGYGIVWLTLAVSSMLYQRKFPFNMGWWSFVFPLGVFTLSTYTLGTELPSRFFKIVGIVFTCILVCLWIFVAGDQIRHTVRGDVFQAPWLRRELPRVREQREKNRQGTEEV